jgi:hypothetical protein
MGATATNSNNSIMKTLIDNTLLHRIYTILQTEQSNSPIRLIDAIALLHFVEHIMFTDEMEVALSGDKTIAFNSQSAVDLLTKRGYIVGEDSIRFLSLLDFSEQDYASACEDAIPAIIADLGCLNKDDLQKCVRFADDAAKPKGMGSPQTEKWFQREWSSQERFTLKEENLSQKVHGVVDYAVCSSDSLYQQLRMLNPFLSGASQEFQSLDIIFRTAINQSLASRRKDYYSPAPQRANVIHQNEIVFRQALTREISLIVSSIKRKPVLEMLEEIQENEVLPLPLLGIHFLKKANISGRLGILETARKLRDDPEVKAIRKWMNEWEANYSANDEQKRKKAKQQLEELVRDLEIDHGIKKHEIKSIIRVEVDPLGFVSVIPNVHDVIQSISTLLKKFCRKRIFLSTVITELSFSTNLDRDLIRILGRPITK